jgi:chromatin segregation and condensation protein Rec8/ScpA/Scc1 (kleisin family)
MTVGQVGIFDLIRAFQKVLKRFENTTDIREIVSDRYTVADKIEHLLEAIPLGGACALRRSSAMPPAAWRSSSPSSPCSNS